MTIYLFEIAAYGFLLFLAALVLEGRKLNNLTKGAGQSEPDLQATTISEAEADWIADLLRESLQRRKARTSGGRLAQEK